MSSFAPYIAPILTAVASVFFPPLLGLEGILAPAALGAGIGAGGSLLGSAITGQYVRPENVALGAGLGGLGGAFGGAGGFGGIADALGLGSSASGAAAGGIAETAGAAATEAAGAAAGAAPVAAATPVGAGGTASALAGTLDPVYGSTVVGGSPALGASSSVPTGAYFAAPSSPSSLGSLAKGVVDVGSKVGQTVGLGQLAASVLGGGAQGAERPTMGAGMGSRYTTGQQSGFGGTGNYFGGPLGTAPSMRDMYGRVLQTGEDQGTLGSASKSFLG